MPACTEFLTQAARRPSHVFPRYLKWPAEGEEGAVKQHMEPHPDHGRLFPCLFLSSQKISK